jgi:hypothetical protein
MCSGGMMRFLGVELTREGKLSFITENHTLLWSGKPLGMSVDAVFVMSSCTDFLVILNPNECIEKKVQNLARIRCNGEIVWLSEKPDSKFRPMKTSLRENDDFYTEITSITDVNIFAYSSIGYSDQIDMLTGEFVASEFVK